MTEAAGNDQKTQRDLNIFHEIGLEYLAIRNSRSTALFNVILALVQLAWEWRHWSKLNISFMTCYLVFIY